MTKKKSADQSSNKVKIIIAVIGGLTVIISAYWEFVWKPSQETPTAGTQLSYVGRVIDIDTEEPIRGAKVSLEFQGAPPIVYTDSEGIFRFSVSLIESSLAGRVKVEANRYEDYGRQITLVSNNPNIEDIRLTPSHSTETVFPTATLTSDGYVGKPPDNSELFLVYPNYDPSGYMGDSGDITVEKSPEVVRFIYETKARGPHEWEWKYVKCELNSRPCQFAGVVYLDPPNNFGERPDGGFDLRESRYIRWEARSVTGTVNVEFVIGGIDWRWDDQKECPDRVSVPHPGSMPRVSLGIKTLTEHWQPFEYDLSNQPEDNLKRVVGGFAWVISWGSNQVRLNEAGTGPEQPETFVIEIRNIRYER